MLIGLVIVFKTQINEAFDGQFFTEINKQAERGILDEIPGEITVFLSLTLICVLSLVLGLVESARTAGARLYLRMASDSAVSSVMSYYNRNLWDRYQLLFLEYGIGGGDQGNLRPLSRFLSGTGKYVSGKTEKRNTLRNVPYGG